MRPNGFFPLQYVCTTQYDATMPNVSVAFPPEEIEMTFGEYLGKLGKTQLRIAETEKYAHVTFFFNGGAETLLPRRGPLPHPVARRSSRRMTSCPEMSAYEVDGRVRRSASRAASTTL